ncbi:MAG: hypothetical protein ACOY0T_03055 [Myxococcota bacterium]
MLKQAILFASLMASGAGLLGVATGAFRAPPRPTQVTLEALPRAVEPPSEVVFEGQLTPSVTPSAASAPSKSKRVVRRVSAAKPAGEARACGGWSEIGAIYKAQEGATGVHRVRALCF